MWTRSIFRIVVRVFGLGFFSFVGGRVYVFYLLLFFSVSLVVFWLFGRIWIRLFFGLWGGLVVFFVVFFWCCCGSSIDSEVRSLGGFFKLVLKWLCWSEYLVRDFLLILIGYRSIFCFFSSRLFKGEFFGNKWLLFVSFIIGVNGVYVKGEIFFRK